MNHHTFRKFVKDLSNDVIKSWGIKPAYFKAVCMVLSMYGDYETGKNIRPSWLTVAEESGVNRKTAMKVRDVLISNDILIQKGTTEGNIAIYDLGSVVHLKARQLSITEVQLSTSDEQLSTIDGHNSKDNITLDIKEIVIQDSNESCRDQRDLVDSPPSLDSKYITPQEMYKLTASLWD